MALYFLGMKKQTSSAAVMIIKSWGQSLVHTFQQLVHQEAKSQIRVALSIHHTSSAKAVSMLPLIPIVLMLSLYLDWMTFLSVIASLLIIFKSVTWGLAMVFKHLTLTLRQYPFDEVAQKLRDGLQLCKFNRMIWLGCERTYNTNLLLQNEEEQTLQQLSLQNYQIQLRLVGVIRSIDKISKTVPRLFQQNNAEQKLTQSLKIPLNFKTIFSMHQVLTLSLSHLGCLCSVYQQELLNPFSRYLNMVWTTYQVYTKVVPQLESVKGISHEIKMMIDHPVKKNKPQLQQLKAYLSNDDQSSKQITNMIQGLLSRIQHQDNKLQAISGQVDQTFTLYTDTFLDSAPQRQCEQVLPRQVYKFEAEGKKDFMRRLDGLLTIGMLRRQQELLEEQTQLEMQVKEIE